MQPGQNEPGGAGYSQGQAQFAPWYQAFQQQHPVYPSAVTGQGAPPAGKPQGYATPEEYYMQPGQNETGGAGYSQGQALGAALNDLKWSQDFAQQYGKSPTDLDWQNHWYQRRGLTNPASPPAPRPQQQAANSQWTPPWVYWR